MPKRWVTDYELKPENEKDWTIPWGLLRSGDVEKGLAILREEFDRLPAPSETLSLGVGYMWAGMYEVASQHFTAAAHSKRTPSEKLFGFAGAAEWHLENKAIAVKLWQEGLKAPYAVGGVCSQPPMLLFAASVLQPGSFSKQDAEGLIASASERVRAKFQAALGRFLLGQIEEKDVEPYWVDYVEKYVRGEVPYLKWLTEFYKNVLSLSRDEQLMNTFRSRMHSITDTSTREWSDMRSFVSLLGQPEFFIARSEASRVS